MQLRDAIGNQGRLPGAACGSECSIGGCHCHHCDAAVANRTASATDRPCAARTSTCRNLATISSGLCLFLAIRILLRLQKPYFREDHFSGGRPGMACPYWVIQQRPRVRRESGPGLDPRGGAKTAYIEPGSPWENGYCESFNSKL